MARKSPTKSPFPKKTPVAKGLFKTHGSLPSPSKKALAMKRDALANETYHRDKKAHNNG